ncbi:MAG TPA: AAA family ATPase, partial [Leptospiraceae bacterium]|nr:AAA family ATPase [Leptospiraceae bacterium]
YSGLGNSNRLEEYFLEHKKAFADEARKIKDDKVPKPTRLLYAELIHSQLSVLSFFLQEDKDAIKFLEDNLGILSIESILLSIFEPDWSTKAKMESEMEYKFFGSSGVVRNLLYHLHDEVAFAPIRDVVKPKTDLWQKVKNKKGIDVIYLYIQDIEKIRKYIQDKDWNIFQFFHVLNTANVSKLLTREGIQLRVRKKTANHIQFKELSEGEQQLLTVLGLMRFTVTDEALFLLDEPDTHLNPYWQWKYMDFINQIVLQEKDSNNTIQVIMTSHSPLSIGSLTKEEVRIFYNDETGKVGTYIPDEDPQGMGVEGILTSIFGLPTVLDLIAQRKIDRRDELYNKKFHSDERLSNEEEKEYKKLFDELEYIGIKSSHIDPIYEKFLQAYKARFQNKGKENRALNPEEIAERKRIAEEILKSLLDEENK